MKTIIENTKRVNTAIKFDSVRIEPCTIDTREQPSCFYDFAAPVNITFSDTQEDDADSAFIKSLLAVVKV